MRLFLCNTTQAYQIEKHIKNIKSANYIRNFLKYPEIADKLFSKKLNRFYVGSSDKFITLDTIHKKANLNDWLYFYLYVSIIILSPATPNHLVK